MDYEQAIEAHVGERILWHALEYLENSHDYSAIWLREFIYEHFVNN